jgi:hypothetical protein
MTKQGLTRTIVLAMVEKSLNILDVCRDGGESCLRELTVLMPLSTHSMKMVKPHHVEN